jgi:hypothetical protein
MNKSSDIYIEQEELDSRIQKLASFIGSNPALNRVSNGERQRQLCQLSAMKKYKEVLRERIKIIGITENSHVL